MKCLTLFIEMKLYSIPMSSNGLKDWNRQEGLEDDPRSGRLSTAQNQNTVTKVHKLVATDNRITLKLEYKLHVNKEIICQILHENFGNRKTCTKSVPHSLILPWQWSASWQIAAWWVTAIQSAFLYSLKLKLPQMKTISGLHRHQPTITANLNADPLDTFNDCFVQLLDGYIKSVL
jgi:hypothetical protein